MPWGCGSRAPTWWPRRRHYLNQPSTGHMVGPSRRGTRIRPIPDHDRAPASSASAGPSRSRRKVSERRSNDTGSMWRPEVAIRPPGARSPMVSRAAVPHLRRTRLHMVLPAMVTLTYPGMEALRLTGPRIKRHMMLWRKRFQREWGEPARYIWKLEFQRRGAPHIHLWTLHPRDAGLLRREGWCGGRWRPAGTCRAGGSTRSLRAAPICFTATGEWRQLAARPAPRIILSSRSRPAAGFGGSLRSCLTVRS